MTDAERPKEGQLILYQTPEGAVRVEVLYESETFWLSQKKMAELFGGEIPTISYHLKEVYESNELSREATLRKLRTVQKEGRREVRREIEFYNLDAIISVGYGVIRKSRIVRRAGIALDCPRPIKTGACNQCRRPSSPKSNTFAMWIASRPSSQMAAFGATRRSPIPTERERRSACSPSRLGA
jgi:hypothetical protein